MITDMDDILTPVAKKHGIGLINASALHMGVLAEGDVPEWHPAPAQVIEAGRRAVELCKARGEDLISIALRFCADHSYVSTTLVGMSTRRHVSDNLRALGKEIDDQLKRELDEIVAPVFNYVWASGRVENRDATAAVGSAEAR
jgi:L-galactose dehydrogenase